jgi:hypothetical protein
MTRLVHVTSVPTRILAPALAVLGMLAVPTTGHAVLGGTKTFEVGSFDALDKGETKGAAIESSGKVTVGYRPLRAEIPGTTAFSCLARSKDLLVGAADKSSIQRITPVPKRARKKPGTSPLRVETLAELDGVVVTAMAELPGGDVVAATLPGGTLHRVTRGGKVTPFAELKVEQVWAMLVHDKRLLVATGPKGELWSLSLDGGDAKVVLDVDEKDLMSMAVVGRDVVVGTAPRAKLYQVTSELDGLLLTDFGADEVRALGVSGRHLVAAVNKFSDRKLTSLDALTKTLNRTSLVGQPPSGSLANERPPSADAEIHAVDLGPQRDLARASEAPWEGWLSKSKQYFTSVMPLDDAGTVLVSSSAGGKIYRVRGRRNASTVADLEERQATALCRAPKGPVFATTAHGAAVYQLDAAPASEARYRTEVLDAKFPASYGALVLRGAGAIEVRARSGPSKEPDKRWSEWKTVKLAKEGSGRRGRLVDLPHRRYLQVEVALQEPGSELRSLEVFYAPENLPPLMTGIAISRPSFDPNDGKEPSSDVTIKWKVDDRDGDKLLYDVRVRPEGADDSQWMKLNADDELVTKTELKWDLTTVPDGVYEVEVKASDEPSNGTANALTDQLVSAPFVVDRQRPTISGAVVDGNTIRATATDIGGIINDVSFSINGGPFRAASPKDGLFDGPMEAFELTLPETLGQGSHRVVIRARDSFGNIGTLAVVVKR